MRLFHRNFLRRRPRLGRAVLVLLSATLAAMFAAEPAFAYNLEGPKWAGTPNSGCCAYIHVSPNGASDSSGLNIMSSFDAQGFRDAVNAWNGPGPNVILDFHSGALKLYDPTVSNVSWDGLTTYNTDWWSGDFTDAAVKLNTYYTRNYSAWTIQGIAVHELGHAMGIDHVSDHYAVMYPDTPGRYVNTPSTDDDNGINALY